MGLTVAVQNKLLQQWPDCFPNSFSLELFNYSWSHILDHPVNSLLPANHWTFWAARYANVHTAVHSTVDFFNRCQPWHLSHCWMCMLLIGNSTTLFFNDFYTQTSRVKMKVIHTAWPREAIYIERERQRETERETETERDRDRERQRQIDRQRDRERERERQGDREGERQTQTQTDRHKQRQRQRQTETEREDMKIKWIKLTVRQCCLNCWLFSIGLKVFWQQALIIT